MSTIKKAKFMTIGALWNTKKAQSGLSGCADIACDITITPHTNFLVQKNDTGPDYRLVIVLDPDDDPYPNDLRNGKGGD